MPRKTLVIFTVKGGGTFPFDMLRYDGCHPASSEDVSSMLDDINGRRVRLHHVISPGERVDAIPTKGRWASFAWAVEKIELR